MKVCELTNRIFTRKMRKVFFFFNFGFKKIVSKSQEKKSVKSFILRKATRINENKMDVKIEH